MAIIVEKENVFLGTGLKYPVSVYRGSAELTAGKELVQQSIGIILNTAKGTRFMLPEYGSRLHECIFEPNDEILSSLLRMFIQEAIAQWEKRVKFVDVTFKFGLDNVQCRIFYKILSSNEIDSFIYPFYKQLKY